MTRTHTHTVAELAISGPAYDEIRKLLEAAGYQHAFDAEGMIDMTGIGVTRGDVGDSGKGDFVHPHWTDLFDGADAYLTWREGQQAAAASLEIDQLRSALSAAVSILEERTEAEGLDQ